MVKKDDGTYLQAFQYGSTNARLMDYDYLSNQLKILGAISGQTLSEYTEFTATVPSWTKSYVYLGDSQLSTITPNGSGGEVTEYNHPDRLGTKLTTNQSAGTNYEQTALPFGTALNAETTKAESKRFTSYERSARTELDYAVNRTYDSKQGRFTQVDPIGISASSLGSPQTLNLYNYCGNDPINHVDPDGLFFGKLFKWIGKAFKAINKILKWVIIAVAVVAVAIAIIQSGGAALGFLKAIFGVVGKLLGVKIVGPGVITNLAGQVVGVQLGTSISIGVGAKIAVGLYGVGAVASQFSNSCGGPGEPPCEEDGVEYVFINEERSWWKRFLGIFTTSTGDLPGFPKRTPKNDLSKLRPDVANCIRQVEDKYGKEFRDFRTANNENNVGRSLTGASATSIVGYGITRTPLGAVGGFFGSLAKDGSQLIWDDRTLQNKYHGALRRCGVELDFNKGKSWYKRIAGIKLD